MVHSIPLYALQLRSSSSISSSFSALRLLCHSGKVYLHKFNVGMVTQVRYLVTHSMSWILVFPNISQNKTFSMNCNMGSGKRGPVRLNTSCSLMSLPKVCNLENKQTISSLILVRLLTKLLTKNYF